MNLQTEKLIPDLRIFEIMRVSKESGRIRLKDLEASGEISPLRTPTGRCFLSVADAEVLVEHLQNGF